MLVLLHVNSLVLNVCPLRFNTSGLPSFASAPSTPFVYKHKGSLAYLGEYGAVSDFTQVQSETGGPTAPLAGKKLKGILSWLVWRSAYLTKLGSWRNRLQVKPLRMKRTSVRSPACLFVFKPLSMLSA